LSWGLSSSASIQLTWLDTATVTIVVEARRHQSLPVEHHAMGHAERERRIWLIVRWLALEYAERAAS
jgi:hypothetical protein